MSGCQIDRPQPFKCYQDFHDENNKKISLTEAIKNMVKHMFLKKRDVYPKHLKINTQFFK